MDGIDDIIGGEVDTNDQNEQLYEGLYRDMFVSAYIDPILWIYDQCKDDSSDIGFTWVFLGVINY